jgi:hypothetical protein
MSDPSKLDAILGKAVRDRAFREQLLDDPSAAAAGFDLSDEELGELTSMDKETASAFFSGAGAEVVGMRPKDWCTEKSCNETG